MILILFWNICQKVFCENAPSYLFLFERKNVSSSSFKHLYIYAILREKRYGRDRLLYSRDLFKPKIGAFIKSHYTSV